jgi:hypothetical protein
VAQRFQRCDKVRVIDAALAAEVLMAAPSYYDRRVRNAEDYINFKHYIRQNPVKRGLCNSAEEYPYSSAYPGFILDEVPERLKITLSA